MSYKDIYIITDTELDDEYRTRTRIFKCITDAIKEANKHGDLEAHITMKAHKKDDGHTFVFEIHAEPKETLI